MGTGDYIQESKWEKYDLQQGLRKYLENGVFDGDELRSVVPHNSLCPRPLKKLLNDEYNSVYDYARRYQGLGVTADITNALIEHYEECSGSPWNKECPVPDCDYLFGPGMKISQHATNPYDSLEKYHFYRSHEEYERKYTLIKIMKDWHPISSTSRTDVDKNNPFPSVISPTNPEGRIEEHPFIDKDVYVDHFGSWTTAKLEADQYDHNVGDSVPVDQNEEPSIYNPESFNDYSYGRKWESIRQNIYERDERECRVCDEKDTTHHVHHITPARRFVDRSGEHPTDYDAMNDDSNLITLCPTCHGKLEGKWEDLDHNDFARRGREYLELESPTT